MVDVSGGTPLRTTTLTFLMACLITAGSAQKKSPKKNPDASEHANAQQTDGAAKKSDLQLNKDEDEDKGPWKNLQYRLIGPYRGGRVVAVSGVVGQDNV